MKGTLGFLALVFGALFAAGEIWGVWDYMHREQGEFNYLVAMGLLVAGAFALLPAWAALAWRTGGGLSVALYACWLVAGVVVVGAALTRTGGAVDQAQLDRVSADRAHRIAEQSVADATRQLAGDERTVSAECASGNGPRCQDARRARDATQSRLTGAREALLAAKGSAGDALARRLASTGYVTEDQVRNVWPLLVPLLGSALSAFLISLGVALLSTPAAIVSKKHNPIQPEPPKPDPLPIPSKSVSHLKSNVVALKAKRTEGEVVKFMLERMPAAKGSRVEIVEVFEAYGDWCDVKGFEPIPAKDFAETFSDICGRAAIKTQKRDGKVYCVGRKLSA